MSRAALHDASATPLVAFAAAGALVAAWLSLPSQGELAFMRYKDGHPVQAAGIYERLLAGGDDSVDVVVPLANIYMAQGRAEKAVALLEPSAKRHPADAGAHELLAEAYRLAGHEADYLRETRWLAEHAPSAGRLRLLAWLYERNGDAERQQTTLRHLMRHHPGDVHDRVRLASLLVHGGNIREGAQVMGMPGDDELKGLDAQERTAHFQVLLATGRLERAASDLTARAADPATPPQSFTDLADAYLKANHPADGLRRFALLRALRPLPETHAGWARLAAAAGHGTLVAAWLAEGSTTDPALLADLYHLGADSGQTELALAAATRRFTPDSDTETRRQLALALLAAGRNDDALSHLRALAPASGGDASLYRATLERLGRTAELAAYLREHVASPGTANDKRRQAAFDLLAMGQRDAALELFRSLAKNAPPDDPDVRQLLYLWGPRPGPDALDWLETRAARTRGAERNTWLKLLLDLGGAARVVTLIDRTGGPPDPMAIRLHLQALSRTGEQGRLKALVRAYLPAESDPEQLRQYAALTAYDETTTEIVWKRLLAVAPNDPEVLRQLGVRALARREYPAAATWLAQSVKQEPDDLDTRYAYAATLSQLGRDAEAAEQYRATLSLASTAPDRTETRLAVANSLDQLGRTGEAVSAFEQLRLAHPGNQGILGEYAAMLYRNGLLDRFREVTEGHQP